MYYFTARLKAENVDNFLNDLESYVSNFYDIISINYSNDLNSCVIVVSIKLDDSFNIKEIMKKIR